MRLPRTTTVYQPPLLLRRADTKAAPPARPNQALIVAVVLVSLTVFAFIIYILLRILRKRQPEPPKFLPEALRRRWRAWYPRTYTVPSSSSTSNTPRPQIARNSRRNNRNRNTGVDRNTSVRSVMTLPEYRPVAAADLERTIGREGERGGIDVVIEFPETVDEEEQRREEHMAALYEIRRARAAERAARSEGGEVAAEAVASAPTSAAQGMGDVPHASATSLLRALREAQERERRMSEVQYAAVGVARHDGTRVRPSMDSDRPLLDAAAPMGEDNVLRPVYSRENPHPLERRRSDEIFGAQSVRGSIASEGRQSQDRLLGPPDGSPPTLQISTPPTEYDGSDWGPPPEYSGPVEAENRSANGLPVLRIDTGTPLATTPVMTPISRSETPVPPVHASGEQQQQQQQETGAAEEDESWTPRNRSQPTTSPPAEASDKSSSVVMTPEESTASSEASSVQRSKEVVHKPPSDEGTTKASNEPAPSETPK